MTTKKEKKSNNKKKSEKETEKVEIDSTKKKIEEMEAKICEYEDIIKRQQAEFDNYRKRTLKERDDIFKYSGLDIFKDLLNTIDNFDRALNVETEDSAQRSFLDGFSLIDQQLKELLTKYNVKEIEGDGAEFDPNLHQAIAFEEDDNVKCDTVADILQKGYILHERVIRPATVRIKKPKKVVSEENTNETNESNDSEEQESSN